MKLTIVEQTRPVIPISYFNNSFAKHILSLTRASLLEIQLNNAEIQLKNAEIPSKSLPTSH